MGKSKRRGKMPPPRPASAPGRRPVRPRRSPWATYWPVAAVGAILVVALIAVFLYARSSATPAAPPAGSTSAKVVDQITHLDLNATAAVGAGGVHNPFKPGKAAQPLTGPGGHPEVLYIGAEYCPYCAAERWSLVVALSRFGTFSGLALTQSSSTDIYPDTPTLTFAKTAFQSSSVDFVAVETEDRQQRPLQQPTATQAQAMGALDPAGSIPFVDVANGVYAVGAGFLPDSLQGRTWDEVAAALQDPSSPIGQQVLGNANWITAAVCRATADSAPACAIPQIKALESQLGG